MWYCLDICYYRGCFCIHSLQCILLLLHFLLLSTPRGNDEKKELSKNFISVLLHSLTNVLHSQKTLCSLAKLRSTFLGFADEHRLSLGSKKSMQGNAKLL